LRAAALLFAKSYDWPDGPCLVLAPHPDDETLGCGGTIAAKADSGERVVVVIATDGSLSDRLDRSPNAVRSVRAQEARGASAALGVAADDLHLLSIADGRLAEHRDELVAYVNTLIKTLQPREVLICAAQDGHPDHVALHSALVDLRVGEAVVHEYMVWSWHRWPRLAAAGAGPESSLKRAKSVVETVRRSRRCDISSQLPRKADAAMEYDSQYGEGEGGGLPVQMFQEHLGRYEVLLVSEALR
jgi:LmbE family N-acetylglucosaminyl deacetylase